MPMVEAEGKCPQCGAGMMFRFSPTDDAPPEAVTALQRGMATYAFAEERRRHAAESLRRLRTVFYLVSAGMVVSCALYITGTEMVSKWSAVAASATSALAYLTTAWWVCDLKERATE